MSRFRKYDNGDPSIEENRDNDAYRWVTWNPAASAPDTSTPTTSKTPQASQPAPPASPLRPGLLRRRGGLPRHPLRLRLSFRGNHDEIIARAFFRISPLACLLAEPEAKAVDIQPALPSPLEDCRLQGRIDVITRTNSYQVRTGDYSNDVISVYLILRRYWGDRPETPLEKLITQMGRARRKPLPRATDPQSPQTPSPP